MEEVEEQDGLTSESSSRRFESGNEADVKWLCKFMGTRKRNSRSGGINTEGEVPEDVPF